MKPVDVVVLGAGMVGVSVAYHARERGLDVVLLDRRGAGEETSYGNAGVVDGANLLPAAMPRDLGSILAIASNRLTAVRYHPLALPALALWLVNFWRWSAPDRMEETAAVMRPLFAAANAAHLHLAREAGAEHYFRDSGWIRLCRTPQGLADLHHEIALLERYGMPYEVLNRDGLAGLEPAIKPIAHAALWTKGALTVSSPGGVTASYARAFTQRGGRFVQGDAGSLRQAGDFWSVDTADGPIIARQVVVALGPWSTDLLQRFGYRLPMAVKRGYHQHFAPIAGASLGRQVVDNEVGYVLCPMEQGIRLTTGVELAQRDAPATPVQVQLARAAAHDILDMGEPVEAEPWKGARPSFADSRPVIGWAPRHRGMMLAFGHNHWGFTLGPVTGEVVSHLLVGEPSPLDLAPFAVERFI